ncbi:AraC family transcriptional regulator [Lacrimispora sphenoides]|uniref:DNA gyrase inhibitor GyrI n=1 Tax=Lacrimispora sphenoides JCM 1415 TaxID=1297793 RepID=A0ABY1C120_9FIRM|nr:GyrI-like domain-containing protein [Lacrimispora sphenoides]SET50841.1 DNA gyrase inhibitor GyrI [[Clostridium] sphenoides JCM 1415]SUY49515.1 DNA gyrase inhibitor [Lacrimispora sphenoides]
MTLKIEQIEQIAPCSMAYIRHTGPYGPGNTETMERLKHWAKSRDLMNSHSVILGIAQDNPQMIPPEACRYDACILLPDGCPGGSSVGGSVGGSVGNSSIEKEVHIGSITGGKYGVFTIDHTAEAVKRAWEEVFPQLFAESYIPDSSRPILERYKAELIERHLCEICIPIQ